MFSALAVFLPSHHPPPAPPRPIRPSPRSREAQALPFFPSKPASPQHPGLGMQAVPMMSAAPQQVLSSPTATSSGSTSSSSVPGLPCRNFDISAELICAVCHNLFVRCCRCSPSISSFSFTPDEVARTKRKTRLYFKILSNSPAPPPHALSAQCTVRCEDCRVRAFVLSGMHLCMAGAKHDVPYLPEPGD